MHHDILLVDMHFSMQKYLKVFETIWLLLTFDLEMMSIVLLNFSQAAVLCLKPFLENRLF